jgi:acetyltransferase-like isoleucine patch superfamily enzyme
MVKIMKIIVGPMYYYMRWLVSVIKVLLKNPTLEIGRNAVITNSTIGKYNSFAENTQFSNSTIGDYSYIAQGTIINNASIGKFTCVGPDVLIGLGEHPTEKFVSIHPIFYSLAKQVGVTFASATHFDEFPNKAIIGNDVWIGSRVIILGSAKIGNGAIIASGAVITKDVPPYAIVAGIPAKVIKKRFSEKKIESLQESQWWNQSEHWLKENQILFCDVERFCNAT